MRFLVDAQLPRRVASWLGSHGHDAIHTLDLPTGNRTTDEAILDFADRYQRIVVTKDADFVDSFLLRHRPEKLLLISTGNITNTDLERLLTSNLTSIVVALETADYVELSRTAVIVHG
jgi:predicted nuclease of predicted toxin-antitoxin system